MNKRALVSEVISRYNGVPFSYGMDCCQLAGDCIEAVTGNNPMHNFNYKTEREALRIIKDLGGLESAITMTIGEPYSGFEDGDVCLVEMTNGHQAAGVAYRGRVIVRTARDLMDLPREAAKVVWSNGGLV